MHGQALAATIAGERAFSKARAMSREIERRLTPENGRVVLDISGVTSGQNVGLSVRTTLRRRAGRLTIVASGQRLDRLMRVSALDDLLAVTPSIKHARHAKPRHADRAYFAEWRRGGVTAAPRAAGRWR